MSKLSKFLTRPHIYLLDAVKNAFKTRRRYSLTPTQIRNGKPTAVLVGFSEWKTFMIEFLPDYNVVFLGHSPKVSGSRINSITRYPAPHVFAWSYKFPPYLQQFCSRHSIPLQFVEDGFIRSIGLGASRTKPLSLVFDRKAMHFDRVKQSTLDDLLDNYDFAANPDLMAEATALAERIRTTGLSKYNFAGTTSSVAALFSDASQNRVLVLGQVEDDLSIRYGAQRLLTGNDLVLQAIAENPDAQVFYRPHPESLAFAKPHYSSPADVSDLCEILGPEYALVDCIRAADIVYTVTSLAGFEAALHGKTVITHGVPFYAGWGFTQDRDPAAIRPRTLTAVEVLAAAYILYPVYFHPISNARIGVKEAVAAMGTTELEI